MPKAWLILHYLKLVLVCALLLALAGVGVQAILLLHAATVAARALPGAVTGELQATRAALIAEVQATRSDLTTQLTSAREDLLSRTDRQVSALRGDVMGEVAEVRKTVDRRLGDTLERVDTALATMDALHGDLKPTLDNAAAITAQAKDASAILLRRDALPAQLLGVTAAAKVTLGQTAETMREIQRATPEIVSNIKATTQASTEASKNTALVLHNFAEATKPLPKWARVALAVAPPLVQVGATVATTVAITGK
jgi:methyl-accepting chemotaxis protein